MLTTTQLSAGPANAKRRLHWPAEIYLPDAALERARPLSLLKLHGSLNWLCCPRCQKLWANPAYDIVQFGDWVVDRECTCGASMEPLLVTPSFVKDYRSLDLRLIWKDARQALCQAPEWIFIGYSLPSDDAWVRTLLLRSLATLRSQSAALAKVTVVNYDHLGKEDRKRELQDRYKLLLGSEIDPEFLWGGFEEFTTRLVGAER